MADPDPRCHITDDGQVHVLELTLPRAVDPVEFDRLNESLAQIDPDGPAQQWIVDLSQVEYVGSAMLGLLVNVRQRIKSAGGKLVLCGLSEVLLKAVRTCSLHNLFTISPNRAEAQKTLKSIR